MFDWLFDWSRTRARRRSALMSRAPLARLETIPPQMPSSPRARKPWLVLASAFGGIAALVIGLFVFQPWHGVGSPSTGGRVEPTKPEKSTNLKDRYSNFVQDMNGWATEGEEGIRKDLLQAVQASELVVPEERALLLSLSPESVQQSHLLTLGRVRRFLESYKKGGPVDSLHFVSEKYRKLFDSLLEDAPESTERTMTGRKRIQRLTVALVALRKLEPKLPPTHDDRLGFLEMIHRLGAADFSDLRAFPRPQVPLFNDAEGAFLSLVEDWMNSSHAQAAMPRELFPRLYRTGKINPFSPAFASYHERLKQRVRDEMALALPKRSPPSVPLADAYSGFEQFCLALTQLGKER